ncbi:hypothetical protein B8W76_05950 [Pseudomonas aeruginosa]|nr:hypothetical protein B8W76_05950 [Pseudomonas aeruginosa]QDB70940.1 hypothetical protein [Pseudomonas phage vB_PaeP_YA3]RQX77191.1 hypothetical protein IPC927_09840 [Pseudomonas aeruginosa]
MTLHINCPTGKYIAQIKGRGCRLWETVGEPFDAPKAAMCAAVNAMTERHKRARVLFCSPWYEPNVVMEAKKP